MSIDMQQSVGDLAARLSLRTAVYDHVQRMMGGGGRVAVGGRLVTAHAIDRRWTNMIADRLLDEQVEPSAGEAFIAETLRDLGMPKDDPNWRQWFTWKHGMSPRAFIEASISAARAARAWMSPTERAIAAEIESRGGNWSPNMLVYLVASYRRTGKGGDAAAWMRDEGVLRMHGAALYAPPDTDPDVARIREGLLFFARHDLADEFNDPDDIHQHLPKVYQDTRK